jgi:XTP/dITP diphosphohydrolase
MKICFATHNLHKLKEIQDLLGSRYQLLSLQDLECREELPETCATLEDNALQKARYVYDHYQVNCFADDTGLLVDALNGAPGVYSARFAGPEKNNSANLDLLLYKLNGESKRSARFRTTIALIIKGKEYLFTGEVEGVILAERRGEGGFGYDPVFLPNGANKTFAEMSLQEKGAISHRGRAVRKLVEFLDV